MKHRYTITLAIAFAALHPTLDGLKGSTAAALKSFGATNPEAAAKGSIEVPLEFSIEREKELTKGEIATLRAAIESDYSRVGAVVTKVFYHGERDTPAPSHLVPPVVPEAVAPAPPTEEPTEVNDDEEAARESAAAAGGTLASDDEPADTTLEEPIDPATPPSEEEPAKPATDPDNL